MYSIANQHSGHVVDTFLENCGYKIRVLGSGDNLGTYVTLKGGCWVLGRIIGGTSVQFHPVGLHDQQKSQTAVMILGDQLALRDMLRKGGIPFNASYFQDLKRQLDERRASLAEERARLSQITPEKMTRLLTLEALVWLGTGGDSDSWQIRQQLLPETSNAQRASSQIAALDAVIAKL